MLKINVSPSYHEEVSSETSLPSPPIFSPSLKIEDFAYNAYQGYQFLTQPESQEFIRKYNSYYKAMSKRSRSSWGPGRQSNQPVGGQYGQTNQGRMRDVVFNHNFKCSPIHRKLYPGLTLNGTKEHAMACTSGTAGAAAVHFQTTSDLYSLRTHAREWLNTSLNADTSSPTSDFYITSDVHRFRCVNMSNVPSVIKVWVCESKSNSSVTLVNATNLSYEFVNSISISNHVNPIGYEDPSFDLFKHRRLIRSMFRKVGYRYKVVAPGECVTFFVRMRGTRLLSNNFIGEHCTATESASGIPTAAPSYVNAYPVGTISMLFRCHGYTPGEIKGDAVGTGDDILLPGTKFNILEDRVCHVTTFPQAKKFIARSNVADIANNQEYFTQNFLREYYFKPKNTTGTVTIINTETDGQVDAANFE